MLAIKTFLGISVNLHSLNFEFLHTHQGKADPRAISPLEMLLGEEETIMTGLLVGVSGESLCKTAFFRSV